jgi:hypothetical protein
MPLSNEQRKKRYAEDPEYRERTLAAGRQRYADDPEFRSKRKEINHRYKLKSREERREKLESDPELREKDRVDRAEKRLSAKYGLRRGGYDRLLQRQHGVCAICEQKPRARLCVDHCHSTRQVRGLLCRKCNTGLGQFDDDPRLLRKAAAYLDAWREAAGTDTAEGGAQLSFDFRPCDEPERVPAEGTPAAAEPATRSCPSVRRSSLTAS